MNTWCKVFRRSPCALVPPHTCAHASTETTGSSRLCGLRAQRLDSPTDTQRPLLPRCARKFAKRGRAQGSRRYACVGAERSGGGASVCAEGTNEKAGKDGMERQRVDMPHVEFKDQEPQLLGENQEQQQGEETRDEEACQGPASQVSSPSVATSSANRQLMMLEGKSGPYFSSLDSSIDMLKKRAQELIENINESRQKDHALMTNFRDSLKIKVSDLTEKLEERMYQIYNHHNKIIQEKLQEFTQKMAKISHLETELKQVCHTVETVYKDLCVQPEATTLEEEQIHKDGEC
ncbi:synaptonemal complex central element protein 2 isoform X3 [Bos javanicus]|uniref:synaptonemal complex central element protein 2 isoform X3 n=2 Tax=Bovinae TaxID=27592 RepID=UPI002AA94376|nr:synaptonemal complex central element protein 2 isoform X3 [Bos javanicus]